MDTARTSRTSLSGANGRPASPPSPLGERARLSIRGVRTPVGVNVARRRAGCVTVTQELPFLSLGTEVTDESGRQGTIARVAVSIDHGVPRLVIELAYDAAQNGQSDRPSGPPAVEAPVAQSSERKRDQTLGYDQRPSAPPPPRVEPARRDDTGREVTLSFVRSAPVQAVERPQATAPLAPQGEASWIDAALACFVAFVAMLVALVSPRTT